MIEKIEEEIADIHLPKRVNKFNRFVAMLISYVFHPAFMTTILAMAIYRFVPATFAGVTWGFFVYKYLLMIFFTTAFVPVLGVVLLKGLGFIDNIHLYNPRDRIIPFVIATICYFVTYYQFKHLNGPFLLTLLLFGGFLNVMALFLINIFFKISMHTAGAGAMIGMVLILLLSSPISMTIPLFLSLFIAGLIGTARMLLGAHRSVEIWAGYIVGIIVQFVAYLYLV